MDDAHIILIIAGFDLIVFTIVTTIYYYESVRGEILGNASLDQKAEQMFAVASGLCALSAIGMALLLWLPNAWVITLNKVKITLDMAIIAYCCSRWALGCWIDPSWYFIPWKWKHIENADGRSNTGGGGEAADQRGDAART